MSAPSEKLLENKRKISVKKPAARSDANVAGDLRLEISANSKKRKGQQEKPTQFDSSKVESPFLDARIIERKKDREKRKSTSALE